MRHDRHSIDKQTERQTGGSTARCLAHLQVGSHLRDDKVLVVFGQKPADPGDCFVAVRGVGRQQGDDEALAFHLRATHSFIDQSSKPISNSTQSPAESHGPADKSSCGALTLSTDMGSIYSSAVEPSNSTHAHLNKWSEKSSLQRAGGESSQSCAISRVSNTHPIPSHPDDDD